MSSTEHAPEPTMDEILASIRKIIADDDQNAAPQSGETAAPDAASTPAPASGEETASSNLVNDIANALNQSPAQSEPEDDIFELTKEVPADAPAAGETPQTAAPPEAGMAGSQPYGQDDPFASRPETSAFPEQSPEEPFAPPPQGDPFASRAAEDPVATPQQDDPLAERPRPGPFTAQADDDAFTAQAPQPITRTPGEAASPAPPPVTPGQDATAAAGEAPRPDFSGESPDVLAGAPMQETPLPSHAAGFESGRAESPASDAGEPVSGAESAFEPAIGGRRADAPDPGDGGVADLDEFTPEPAPAMPPAEDIAMGMPSADERGGAESGWPDFAAAGSASDPGGLPPEPAGETAGGNGAEWSAAGDTAATESAAGGAEAMFGATAFEDTAFGEPARADTAFGEAVAAGAATAASTERTASAGSDGAKTLEESVQEMLRPMLRAWLDENMPRILENAVRRELKSDDDFK